MVQGAVGERGYFWIISSSEGVKVAEVQGLSIFTSVQLIG